MKKHNKSNFCILFWFDCVRYLDRWHLISSPAMNCAHLAIERHWVDLVTNHDIIYVLVDLQLTLIW